MTENIQRKTYGPEDFQPGQYVGIFCAWPTCQDVFIRFGEVIEPNSVRHSRFYPREEPALKLMVTGKGTVVRREPRDYIVFNCDGRVVRGHVDCDETKRLYTQSFLYRCITYVEYHD